MAYHIGLIGEPNTGKSYGRKFLDGREVFGILPSKKETYILHEGKHLPPAKVYNAKADMETIAKALRPALKLQGNHHPFSVVARAAKDKPKTLAGKNLKTEGNWLVETNMDNVPYLCKFISDNMPHIKIICLADFTHFLSEEVGDIAFQEDKKGGSGYAKYTSLAIKTLDTFFRTGYKEHLRDDIIIISEFHIERRDGKEDGAIFVPGGNMLTNWFKPGSYFDILIGSEWDENADSYHYVTSRTRRLPLVRSMGLFDEKYIPNDLSIVIDKFRKYYNK